MKPSLRSSKLIKSTSGFSLVEVTLALGICAFCLISLVALLPSGITATQNASKETTAANIASAILSDFQMSVISGTDSSGNRTLSLPSQTAIYGFTTTSNPLSTNFIALTDDRWQPTSNPGQYRVAIQTNQTAADGPYNFTVKVSWPGVATAREQGSITVFGRSR